MTNKIALSISEPCHENWENMNPIEKARPDDSRLNDAVGQAFGRGKFCGSCQKKVIDFSSMSDNQMAVFFKKSSSGSVCGRFMTDQLDRAIEIPKKRIPWIKYFFNIILPLFFISKASAQDFKIGDNKSVSKDTTRTPMTTEFITLGMVISNQIEPFMGDTIVTKNLITDNKSVKGKIMDENGKPVGFANIQIGKTLNSYVANEKGEFTIGSALLGDKKSLLISSVGFESKVIVLDTLACFLEIKLSPLQLGEISVSSAKQYVKGEIIAGGARDAETGIDKIVERDIAVPVDRNKFFIFPNPVLSGGNLSLGINGMDEGNYTVSIINMTGQLMQQKDIWIDSEKRVLNVDIPKVNPGSYLLVITNKQSKEKMTEKIIIQ